MSLNKYLEIGFFHVLPHPNQEANARENNDLRSLEGNALRSLEGTQKNWGHLLETRPLRL